MQLTDHAHQVTQSQSGCSIASDSGSSSLSDIYQATESDLGDVDLSGLPEAAVDSEEEEEEDEDLERASDTLLGRDLVRECLEKDPRDRNDDDIGPCCCSVPYYYFAAPALLVPWPFPLARSRHLLTPFHNLLLCWVVSPFSVVRRAYSLQPRNPLPSGPTLPCCPHQHLPDVVFGLPHPGPARSAPLLPSRARLLPDSFPPGAPPYPAPVWPCHPVLLPPVFWWWVPLSVCFVGSGLGYVVRSSPSVPGNPRPAPHPIVLDLEYPPAFGHSLTLVLPRVVCSVPRHVAPVFAHSYRTRCVCCVSSPCPALWLLSNPRCVVVWLPRTNANYPQSFAVAFWFRHYPLLAFPFTCRRTGGRGFTPIVRFSARP
uniref:Uncharacterized protein n=1 Tax=Knipowitschia caucasica TaxID=637954 RepID=A0AAV2JFV5_KNICA